MCLLWTYKEVLGFHARRDTSVLDKWPELMGRCCMHSLTWSTDAASINIANWPSCRQAVTSLWQVMISLDSTLWSPWTMIYCLLWTLSAQCMMLMTGRTIGWQPAALSHIAAQPAAASLIVIATDLLLHHKSSAHTQASSLRSCSYMLQHDHALAWTSSEHLSVHWVVAQEEFLQQMQCDKRETVIHSGQHAAQDFWRAWALTTYMGRASALLAPP